MNILILGANGFIGTNVCKCLDENHMKYIKAPRQVVCDLKDLVSTQKLLQETMPDFIINCAAKVGSLNYVTEKAAEVITENAKMILSMYEAVAAVCPATTIINPIANCAYPGMMDVYVEKDWQNGELHRSVLAYGSTRRFMWAAGECYKMQYGIRSISLMVPNMYGPYDSTDPNKAHALNALVSKFVKAEHENKPEIEIWGTGSVIREWLYAGDFARIIVQIIQHSEMVGFDKPFNVAQKFGLSVKALVNIIQERFKYSGKVCYNTNMPDGAPKKIMDDENFRKLFPAFRFKNFNDGIKETIDYYNHMYPY